VKFQSLLLLMPLLLCATKVVADEDDSYSNYDSIVSELRDTAERAGRVQEPVDWDAVALHGAMAVTGSYISVAVPEKGLSGEGLLKGFELQAGFNLFSRLARGEVLFRNFNQDTLSNNLQASFHEFEGRIVFLPVLADRTLLRMGGGLSLRSIDVRSTEVYRDHELRSYYSLLVGFEKKIAKTISVGPDFTRHASMDTSSVNKSSWDASFRLNATF